MLRCTAPTTDTMDPLAAAFDPTAGWGAGEGTWWEEERPLHTEKEWENTEEKGACLSDSKYEAWMCGCCHLAPPTMRWSTAPGVGRDGVGRRGGEGRRKGRGAKKFQCGDGVQGEEKSLAHGDNSTMSTLNGSGSGQYIQSLAIVHGEELSSLLLSPGNGMAEYSYPEFNFHVEPFLEEVTAPAALIGGGEQRHTSRRLSSCRVVGSVMHGSCIIQWLEDALGFVFAAVGEDSYCSSKIFPTPLNADLDGRPIRLPVMHYYPYLPGAAIAPLHDRIQEIRNGYTGILPLLAEAAASQHANSLPPLSELGALSSTSKGGKDTPFDAHDGMLRGSAALMHSFTAEEKLMVLDRVAACDESDDTLRSCSSKSDAIAEADNDSVDYDYGFFQEIQSGFSPVTRAMCATAVCVSKTSFIPVASSSPASDFRVGELLQGERGAGAVYSSSASTLRALFSGSSTATSDEAGGSDTGNEESSLAKWEKMEMRAEDGMCLSCSQACDPELRVYITQFQGAGTISKLQPSTGARRILSPSAGAGCGYSSRVSEGKGI